MTDLIVGPPATGERFYYREELVKLIWNRLKSGNILLVAPRRFGKTSVMLNLRDKPKQDYHPIFLDVESYESPTWFVVELIAEMTKELPGFWRVLRKAAGFPKGLLKFLKENITNIEIAEFKIGLREHVDKDWNERGKVLFKLAERIDGKALIILDELPLMVKRMLKGEEKDSIETFLFWLRSFRQGGSSAMENVRFIVGGSIGIMHVLNQADAVASINDLESIKVNPFSRGIAENLVRELFESKNKQVDGTIVQKVLQEVEIFVPFFLQLLVSETCKLAQDKKEDISPSLVSEAYKDRVISVESRTYFEHFYSRLKDYYEPDEELAAKAMLRELALKGTLTVQNLRSIYVKTAGKPSDGGFSHLISDLENDFYLQRQYDSYVFHTKVLRDWWVRFYGFE